MEHVLSPPCTHCPRPRFFQPLAPVSRRHHAGYCRRIRQGSENPPDTSFSTTPPPSSRPLRVGRSVGRCQSTPEPRCMVAAWLPLPAPSRSPSCCNMAERRSDSPAHRVRKSAPGAGYWSDARLSFERL
ncbi:hypothetical protein AMECASPLE_012498 [Ameca splendens]|uniref:Uncharacterized protein n=1 Tax=Ameca splendens TaxID=208324 RepID=A0ABV0YBZ6_9TELE